MGRQLVEVAACRSGDKGNLLDLSLMMADASAYATVSAEVTAARVARHLAPWANGPVVRYELPRLCARKFVVHGALDGGATASLRVDNLGKTLGAALLRLEIDWPDGSPSDRSPQRAGQAPRTEGG